MSSTDFDALPLPDLERRLTTQAAIVAAETAEFLALLTAFDRREGWRGDGVKSCAHWMNWQLGTSFRTAREQLRVGHALAELPLIRASFEAGEITYSRVRAITRIALPETEEHLLMLARESTGAQLDTMVRTYDLLAKQNDEDPPAPPAPELHRRREPDGRVTISLTTDAADAEMVMQAVHAAMTPDAERPLVERRADALVAVTDSYLAQGPADRSGNDRTSIQIHEDARRAFLPDGTRLDEQTKERATCEARRSRKSPGVSASLRRQLLARDGGCIWPGCNAVHHLHAHHVIHRKNGGPTTLDNLVLLCGHHHRLLHGDGYSIRRLPDTTWEIRRADGSIVAATPTKLTVPRNRIRRRIDDPATALSRWTGDPLDTAELVRIPVKREAAPTG